MRIGCSPAYAFAHFADRLTYEDLVWSARRVAELGFCGLQLETYNRGQKDLYAGDQVYAIRDMFQDLGLEISQFNVHSLKSELASLDSVCRAAGIEAFKELVEIATKLGQVDVICLPASPPSELIVEYYETYPGAIQPVLSIPSELSWQRIWDTYAETLRRCLDITVDAGMKLAIEGVPFGIISNTDSFLRMAETIGSDGLGFNLDTGHIFVQKEDLAVAIEKLGPRLLGTHICDNDGCVDDHWVPGRGKIDWRAVLGALKKVGYAGPLDIEVNICEDPDQDYLEGKRFLEAVLTELE